MSFRQGGHRLSVRAKAARRVSKGALTGLIAWAKSPMRLCLRGNDSGRSFAHPTCAIHTMTTEETRGRVVSLQSRPKRHPARPDDRHAGAGRRDPVRLRFLSRSDPACQPRSTPGRGGLSRARELSAGPRTTVAERIDELKLHEITL